MNGINVDLEIDQILIYFSKIKESCDKIYKGIANATNRQECEKLVEAYNEIIKNLNIIRERSKVLDNISIQDEQYIIQEREKLANNVLILAQHIRGCMDSYSKYGDMIKK